MRLALVILMLSVAPAVAQKVPPCWTPRPFVRPDGGTAPLNAKIWQFDVRLDADTALVRVTVHAGNESAPVVVPLVIRDRSTPRPIDMADYPTSALALIIFGPILLVVLVVGIVFVSAIRLWRIPTRPGETVSLLVAEQLVRGVLHRAMGLAVASAAAMAGAYMLDRPLASIAFAVLASGPAATTMAARMALRRVAATGAHAELRETTLIITSPTGIARLATSRRMIERARKSAIPMSVVASRTRP